jgi:hypothetical protein
MPAGKCFNVNATSIELCKVKEVGIFDQACMPNQMTMSNSFFECTSYCSDYQNRLRKISGF